MTLPRSPDEERWNQVLPLCTQTKVAAYTSNIVDSTSGCYRRKLQCYTVPVVLPVSSGARVGGTLTKHYNQQSDYK